MMRVVETAPDLDADGTARTPTRGPLVRAVRTMVVVSAIVFSVRTFVIDTVSVGTRSMEPTIVGRRNDPDSTLILRPAYALTQPERFQVVVFRYPLNESIAYVKRLVGFGGEQVFIIDGDLWLAPFDFTGTAADAWSAGQLTRLIKPGPMQDDIFARHPVIARDAAAPLSEAAFDRLCSTPPEDRPAFRGEEPNAITVTGTRRTMARFRQSVDDALGDTASMLSGLSGTHETTGGKNLVGDVAIGVTVTAAATGTRCVFRIDHLQPGPSFEARLTVDGAADLYIDESLAATVPTALAGGRAAVIRFAVADDLASLSVDGVTVLRAAGHHPPRTREPEAAGIVSFGIDSGSMTFTAPTLERDLFWISEGQTRFRIPPGHFLALGDHSVQSNDSRMWRRTAVEVLATGEILTGDYAGPPVSRTGGPREAHNPQHVFADEVTFTDTAGRDHHFRSADELRPMGTWGVPYVPMDALLGRAVAVVWPPARAHWLR